MSSLALHDVHCFQLSSNDATKVFAKHLNQELLCVCPAVSKAIIADRRACNAVKALAAAVHANTSNILELQADAEGQHRAIVQLQREQKRFANAQVTF